MATLYISYFGSVSHNCAGDPLYTETITTSDASAASGTVPVGAMVAQIFSDDAHFVTIGTGTPTASADNGFLLPGGITREIIPYAGLGQALKFAAVTA